MSANCRNGLSTVSDNGDHHVRWGIANRARQAGAACTHAGRLTGMRLAAGAGEGQSILRSTGPLDSANSTRWPIRHRHGAHPIVEVQP